MRTLFYLLLCFSISAFGQRYSTNTGTTKFEASLPTLIPVKANNNASKVIFDVTTEEIAILVYIIDFEFKIPLMQEHFNENYMETESYPKAFFQGRIIDHNTIKGVLTIKGISKNIETPITFLKNETIDLLGTFKIHSEDFNIKVPKIISRKMAEEITVSFNYSLQPKN